MGLFDNLFTKKTNTESNLEQVEATNVEYLKEAEQIASIVTTGLENEDYSKMNEQLTTVVSSDEKKEAYVFEHPSVIGELFAIVIVGGLSIVFAYLLFIGISTLILSRKYVILGLIFLVVSMAILVINVALIRKFVSTIKFKVRYDIYNELIGHRSLEFIEDIAVCAKQKETIVIADLQNAIKQKLIPQGHFCKDDLVFMVSEEIYDKYMEKPAVYDQYFQKKIEERKEVKARTEKIKEIVEMGNQYTAKIHDFSVLVKDKTISRKTEGMENVVSMILHEIDVNPTRAQILGVFLNYYIPTTEKLLNAYVSIGEKKVEGKNWVQMKKEIILAINTITNAFEGILEKIYEEQELELTNDIEALELTMKQEGLII